MRQIFLFLIFTNVLFAQKSSELFNSTTLGESREITVGLPASYAKNPDKKYPILILLDGDYLFDPFFGALSFGEYWQDIPETIVVGINQNKNNERENDSDFDQNEGVPIVLGDCNGPEADGSGISRSDMRSIFGNEFKVLSYVRLAWSKQILN